MREAGNGAANTNAYGSLKYSTFFKKKNYLLINKLKIKK